MTTENHPPCPHGCAHDDSAERSERRFRSLVENASDMIFVVDSQGRIRHAAGAVERALGADPRKLEGTKLIRLLDPVDARLVPSLLDDAVSGRECRGAEWRLRRADGSFLEVETVVVDLLRDPDVRGLVLTMRDISERKAFEEQLRHRAFHDPLTNLANGALFSDRVEHALARRSDAESLVAVLFMDLDDFKTVNDALGHAAGDQLLVGVAQRLRGHLRSFDTAARLGGDEFAVLLEGLRGVAEAEAAARRLQNAMRQPFAIGGDEITVKLSIGVAVSELGAMPAEELVRNADFAMYVAKHNGKAHYELFDPDLQTGLLERFHGAETPGSGNDQVSWFMRGEAHQREIDELLRDQNSITPVFQPLVDLATGVAVGYEALSRFPDGGERPPSGWFAQARRCGRGVELELHALRAALRVTGRPAGTFLALNLSPSTIVSGQAQELLPADLSDFVIEVVETELLSEGGKLDEALDGLRRRGARVAVDDTGAGYAGLKQLVRLRPDIIKLDRSLVSGIHDDAGKRALVDAMVRYAQRIGALVCGEGVEELDELRALADLDVAYGQGYVLARPGPPWPAVLPPAAETCVAALRSALSDAPSLTRSIFATEWNGDLGRLMEVVTAKLEIDETTLSQVPPEDDCVETVACYGADEVGRRYAFSDYRATERVIREREAVHVSVFDPASDPAEVELLRRHGLTSLLMLPVISGSRALGLLELRTAASRIWTRSDLQRAWVVAYQLGHVLAAREEEAPAHRLDVAAVSC